MQTVQTGYQDKKKNDLSPRSTELSQTNIIHIGTMADIQKTPFVKELASSGKPASIKSTYLGDHFIDQSII